jgi:hypothetical protein
LSYDYIIWKRSDTTKTAMLAEVYEAICESKPHPAMAAADMTAFVQAIDMSFNNPNENEDDENPFLYEWTQNDEMAYVVLNCSRSAIRYVEPVVVALALKHGFLIYDTQRECVWGNKRPPHLQRKNPDR